MCIKSEFKEICLKLATNGRSHKGFSVGIRSFPKGFSALAPGLYTCIKSLKMCMKEKRPFFCHKIFVSNGLSASAWGYIHVKKKKKTHKKNGKKSDLKEIFF